MTVKIGYARVSSPDQDPGIQIERLKAAGCAVVRAGTASGAAREGRSELETVIEFLREGDELVVCRLGRSTRDVWTPRAPRCASSIRKSRPPAKPAAW